MTDPLFSVVVPCFNVASTLEETIASISAQTIPELEIVAVDNNSTDRTPELLAALAWQEPRLRIVSQRVQGLSPARNAGIRAAQGRLIALLDADDTFDPGYLEAHRDNLADGRIDISYSRLRLVDPAGVPTGQVTRPRLQGLGPVDLLRSNPCTAMIVVRRRVFDRVGLYNEELRRVEDQEFLFRAAAAGFELRGIDRVLASYRINPAGLSTDLEAMLASHEQMLACAQRISPTLVAGYGRLSRAAMLRYCSRRAIDHGKGSGAARDYLVRMLDLAPDIVLREPIATARTAAAVLMAAMRRDGPVAPAICQAEGS